MLTPTAFARALRLSFPALALLGLGACEKDPASAPPADEQSAAAQMAMASAAFTGGYQLASAQASQDGRLNGFAGGAPTVQGRTCGTVTFTSDPGTFWPLVMRVDYGASCQTPDGRTVGGALVATFDGLLAAEGTSVGLRFEDFTVDGTTLSGQYRVLNQGLDARGRLQHLHTIEGGRVRFADGHGFDYRETTTAHQVEGQATNFFTDGIAGVHDDIWEADKRATLVNSAGQTYTLTTEAPLRRPATCAVDVAGRVLLTGGLLDGAATLDYGTGACDRVAVMTYGGVDYTINF